MKNILRLPLIAAALLALAGCATTQTTPSSPETVNVLVTLPPTVSPIYSSQITEAFTDEVRHVFNQSGYKRPVENIPYVDDAVATPNLLSINLVEWHFDRLGNIECTFTARLETPRGARDLGVYSGTSLGLSRRPGPWGVADSFDEAAQGALVDLMRAITKTDLLPKQATPPARVLPTPKTHV